MLTSQLVNRDDALQNFKLLLLGILSGARNSSPLSQVTAMHPSFSHLRSNIHTYKGSQHLQILVVYTTIGFDCPLCDRASSCLEKHVPVPSLTFRQSLINAVLVAIFFFRCCCGDLLNATNAAFRLHGVCPGAVSSSDAWTHVFFLAGSLVFAIPEVSDMFLKSK